MFSGWRLMSIEPIGRKKPLSALFEQIYGIVKQIPKGQVASYGQIARMAGMPRGARIVGYAMSACGDSTVPCHRVVDVKGNTKKAFDVFSIGTQRMLLEAEGVAFLPDGRVDMTICQWRR